jgi:hypothetical protein
MFGELTLTKVLALNLATLVALAAIGVGIYGYGEHRYAAGEAVARAAQIASTDALNANQVVWANSAAAAIVARSKARREQAAALVPAADTGASWDYSTAFRAQLNAINIVASHQKAKP